MKTLKTLVSILFLTISSSVFAEDFDYVETNVWVKQKGSNISLATRQNLGLDVQQYIVRYDFADTPYRLEYRNVQKGDRQEHWIRGQVKWLSHNGFFYNHRFEQRFREQKDDVLRYRPQFGYESQTAYAGIKPFFKVEPHWQYNYTTKDAGYSHMQTFTGFSYKVNDNLKVDPFVEVDFDKNFDKSLMFVGVDIKFEF
jgi:hypothetical protein